MQPERMSMPMTCGTARRDVLSHVLYGANMDYIARLVEESVINLSRAYPYESVIEALHRLRPAEKDTLDRLRIKFFVLLNEDETMKRNLGNVKEDGQTGMLLVCSLCPFKAERFYDALCDELIPQWAKNCQTDHASFVEKLRNAYLCS